MEAGVAARAEHQVLVGEDLVDVADLYGMQAERGGRAGGAELLAGEPGYARPGAPPGVVAGI